MQMEELAVMEITPNWFGDSDVVMDGHAGPRMEAGWKAVLNVDAARLCCKSGRNICGSYRRITGPNGGATRLLMSPGGGESRGRRAQHPVQDADETDSSQNLNWIDVNLN